MRSFLREGVMRPTGEWTRQTALPKRDITLSSLQQAAALVGSVLTKRTT